MVDSDEAERGGSYRGHGVNSQFIIVGMCRQRCSIRRWIIFRRDARTCVWWIIGKNS